MKGLTRDTSSFQIPNDISEAAKILQALQSLPIPQLAPPSKEEPSLSPSLRPKPFRRPRANSEPNPFFERGHLAPSFLGPFQDLYYKNGRIGIYTPEERTALLERFNAKRDRRVWVKKKITKHKCRRKLAEGRPRYKGRFVKMEKKVVEEEKKEEGEEEEEQKQESEEADGTIESKTSSTTPTSTPRSTPTPPTGSNKGGSMNDKNRESSSSSSESVSENTATKRKRYDPSLPLPPHPILDFLPANSFPSLQASSSSSSSSSGQNLDEDALPLFGTGGSSSPSLSVLSSTMASNTMVSNTPPFSPSSSSSPPAVFEQPIINSVQPFHGKNNQAMSSTDTDDLALPPPLLSSSSSSSSSSLSSISPTTSISPSTTHLKPTGNIYTDYNLIQHPGSPHLSSLPSPFLQPQGRPPLHPSPSHSPSSFLKQHQNTQSPFPVYVTGSYDDDDEEEEVQRPVKRSRRHSVQF